jgi:hypothetical protein
MNITCGCLRRGYQEEYVDVGRRKEQEKGEDYTMRIFVICNFTKQTVIMKIKSKLKNGWDIYHARRLGMNTKLYSENHNGRNYLKEIDVDGRITLSPKFI